MKTKIKQKAKRYHDFWFADGTTLTSLLPITRASARKIHLSDAKMIRAKRYHPHEYNFLDISAHRNVEMSLKKKVIK